MCIRDSIYVQNDPGAMQGFSHRPSGCLSVRQCAAVVANSQLIVERPHTRQQTTGRSRLVVFIPINSQLHDFSSVERRQMIAVLTARPDLGRRDKPRRHSVRFVVNLSYNKLYDRSDVYRRPTTRSDEGQRSTPPDVENFQKTADVARMH